MNELETALKSGEVFSKEYVQKLREEAKSHRRKAETAEAGLAKAKGSVEAGKAAADAAVEAEQRKTKKALALKDIEFMCERAGAKVDPEQIFQEGVEPEKAFNEFVEKNSAMFRKEPTRMHGVDLDGGPSTKMLTEGTMAEIKKDPAARGLLSKMYSRMVSDERQGVRRKVA